MESPNVLSRARPGRPSRCHGILSRRLAPGFLGAIHLSDTFASDKLLPRDPDRKPRLEAISPVLTSQTTMWKAWIGFNASHSLCALLFGAVYGDLALFHLPVLLAARAVTRSGV